MLRRIPVSKLSEVFTLLAKNDRDYDAWGTRYTVEDVFDRIHSNTVCAIDYFTWQKLHVNCDYDHAARIAYLILNPDSTPIEIDVGVPSLGHFDITLSDGNHRTAAAAIRGDSYIEAFIGGEVDYIEHLFFKKLKKYEFI